MDLAFPEDVTQWDWETVESLQNLGEGQYLEFKSTLYPPSSDEPARREWRRRLEREFVAFANANGGVIVFGVADDGSASPFEPPEHEVAQSVIQLVADTVPVIDLDIPDPIPVPSEDSDRIVLPVRVHEVVRKPVLASDSAIFIRVNDRKERMSREQIESMFVEHDRRQQGVRQLEMQINRFHDAITPPGTRINVHNQAPPDYHLVNGDALRRVLQNNTHLYSDEEMRDTISKVFQSIQEIEDQEIAFRRASTGETPIHQSSQERFYKKYRQDLKDTVDRLERSLVDLADQAGLNVDLSAD